VTTDYRDITSSQILHQNYREIKALQQTDFCRCTMPD